MSSTNKTTYYELSQYVGSDKPTYLGDYNSDMLKIDTGLHAAADAADTALTTANAANNTATTASTTASTALSTAQSASATATQAQATADTALTNAGAAQTAAEEAETAARANVITNLAPAYDPSLTYDVGELVTYVDAQGSGKLYKCIVAVTTPEVFNINKWDDVTVSEVYDSGKVLASYTVSNDSTTYSRVIDNLRRQMNGNVQPAYLERTLNTETIRYNFDQFNTNNHSLKFSLIDHYGDGTVVIHTVGFNDTALFFATVNISEGDPARISNTNQLNAIVTNGTTFTIHSM